MSQVKGFLVTLTIDISEEEADEIAAAITRFRGVASVVPSVTEYADRMARERVGWEWRDKLRDLMREMGR